MTSLTQPGHPVRSALRTTGVLGAALVLTIAVVAALASFVDSWA